jgi:Cu-Zn family superoxide dismutase
LSRDRNFPLVALWTQLIPDICLQSPAFWSEREPEVILGRLVDAYLLNGHTRVAREAFVSRLRAGLRRAPDIQLNEWRTMIRFLTNFALLVVLLMGAVSTSVARPPAAAKPVTVNIVDAEGRSVGTAVLTAAEHGVKISLDIKSLPPGAHFIHIHQFPKCEPPDFKSAGPHFDPSGMGHADHGSAGMPAGDIPNFVLTVKADGTAHTSVVAPFVTLGAESNSVFSNGGTSIVIHAIADKVTAAAPPRIACGVITKPE